MAKNKYNYASIDIGGTNVRFALIEELKIVKKIRFQTNPQDWQETLDKIIDLINEHQIDALGLCIPGPADYKNGIILASPNLPGWTNLDIKSYLLEKTNIKKIVFENDANAMALANHRYFNQSSDDVTQFFTISTGFGAGLVINNKIFRGSNGLAQEIAKIPTGDNQPFYLSPFSAEAYISGTGLSKRLKEKFNINMDAETMFKKLEKNTKVINVVNEGILALAKTIAIVIGMLNPNLIVFGGSVAVNNKDYVKSAFEIAKNFCDINQYKQAKLKFDQLKDNSALVGLNHLLLEENEN